MSWHASFLVGTLLGIAIGASLILLLVLILLAGRDTDCTEEDDNEACAIFNQVADALAKAAGFDFGCWSVILDVEDVAE